MQLTLNRIQIGLEPLKVRWVARRANKSLNKTLPEILVGTTQTNEAWARDNGRNRIKIYPTDEKSTGRELRTVEIQWLARFQHNSNPALVDDSLDTTRQYILDLLQKELEDKPAIPTKTPQDKKRKPKPRKKKSAPRKKRKLDDDEIDETDDSAVNDQEVVTEYIDSDHVPDSKTAARIGRAKGRIDLNDTAIPAETITQMKETALRAHISPFFAWEYGQYIKSLPTPPRPRRPLPLSYNPSPPPGPSVNVAASPSPSRSEPGGLEDTDGLDPALLDLYDEAMKSRESMPTLERYMAMYEDLPKLTE